MAKPISRFLTGFLLMMLAGTSLYGADSIINFGSAVQTFSLQNQQEAEALFNEAIDAYRANDFKTAFEALKKLKQMHNNNDENLEAIASIERLVRLKQQEVDNIEYKEKKTKETLDWSLDDVKFTDKNRFLLAVWLDSALNYIIYPSTDDTLRLLMGFRLEGFIPYGENKWGLEIGFHSSFYDIDQNIKAQDFILYNYNIAIQYRLGWNFPAIDKKVTLAIKFGLLAQHVDEINLENTLINKANGSYLLPYVEAVLQDPLLYHVFKYDFMENIVFRPALSIGFRPKTNDEDSYAGTIFGIGLGLYYRISNILFGIDYKYTYQISLPSSFVIKQSMWRFALSYQY